MKQTRTWIQNASQKPWHNLLLRGWKQGNRSRRRFNHEELEIDQHYQQHFDGNLDVPHGNMMTDDFVNKTLQSLQHVVRGLHTVPSLILHSYIYIFHGHVIFDSSFVKQIGKCQSNQSHVVSCAFICNISWHVNMTTTYHIFRPSPLQGSHQ